MKKSKSLLILSGLAIITLLLYSAFPYNSIFIENFYSKGLFKIYRSTWDYTVALLPLPAIYLVLAIALIFVVKPIFSKSQESIGLGILRRIFFLILLAIISFYWLWGFNYKRPGLKHQLPFSKHPVEEGFIFREYCRSMDSLQEIRTRFDEIDDYDDDLLRPTLLNTFNSLGMPYKGRVRIRKIRPKGVLLRISTAGVYLPFAGEGHIDAGLHPLTHPFTMLHEMSHGYGWTGEDECNFLALLASINSPDDQIKYSGYLAYWRYLRGTLFRMDPARFDEFYRDIPLESLKTDYEAILAFENKYPDVLPALRNLIYDSYLKTHGIPSGLINYSQVIVMSYQWQEEHGDLAL